MIEAQERDKYRRMWALPIYSQESPGEHEVRRFIELCKPARRESLIDIGAGTGRAGQMLADYGLDVTLLDFCPEANQTKLHCWDVCIWSLPEMVPIADWIYCTDMLEHIPQEYIGTTLDNMARLTGKGGYIQIALFPDGCGRNIGETLHLTLQPASWWQQQLVNRWDDVRPVCESDNYARFTVGVPRCRM